MYASASQVTAASGRHLGHSGSSAGESGYALVLRQAYRARQITRREWLRRVELHCELLWSLGEADELLTRRIVKQLCLPRPAGRTSQIDREVEHSATQLALFSEQIALEGIDALAAQ